MNEAEAYATLSKYDPEWMRDGLGIRGPAQSAGRFGQPIDFPHASISGVQQGNEPITDQAAPSIGGGSGSIQPFCFQPILKNFGSGWVVGVYVYSLLLADFNDGSGVDNPITITGLLTSPNPTSSDTGWKTTSTSDVGWIRIPVTGTVYPFTFGTAVIESLGAGNSLGPFIENNGGGGPYSQTNARLKLWEMTTGSGGVPAIKYAWVNTPLRMEYGYFNSYDSGGGTNTSLFSAYPKPT